MKQRKYQYTYGLITIIMLAAVVWSCKPRLEKHKDQAQPTKLTFLHTKGHDIVNEHNEKIFLEGVGLGNWLLPEGYMWKFGDHGDRPRKIEKVVSELIGEEAADKFWKEFRANYITESDIKEIARVGFNSVRPALNSRLFMKEGDGMEFLDEGFQLIDSLISWCRKYNLYVIIDMHGAPGGQTGANIDDSPNDEPELFMSVEKQDQLEALWVKIATRYKDEPVVAAYDLLNEPLPGSTGAAEQYKHLLVPLYSRLIDAIRKVDSRHMITIEGYNWANDWSLFHESLDPNAFYQFHYYCWNEPDNLNDISYYVKKRDTLNVPVWVGETGEQGKTIYWATAQYFRKNNIGYSFWPWKKMDTRNTPYSIVKPDQWDLVVEYTKGGVKPDRDVSVAAFDQLLENVKLSNCEYYPDVVNAFFNRVPGKIQGENYGHDGYSQSYYVTDTTTMAKTYRVSEPVPVHLLQEDKEGRSTAQAILLKETEWTSYNFESLESEARALSLRLSSKVPTSIVVTINNEVKQLSIEPGPLSIIDVGGVQLNEGENTVRITAKSGELLLDWMRIE